MASQLIWASAGKPAPCDTLGVPLEKSSQRGRCAKCGSPEGVFSEKQIVSENFLPTRNVNRLRAYGGKLYCPACVFCAKTLRLRCVSWSASEAGFQFWRIRQNDGLEVLLEPPKPPFVIGIPLYGIAHGGETHYQRTWWPGEPCPEDILVRLQSKHVALYARTAMSRDRYPVQVDDQSEFLLERDVWLKARDSAVRLMSTLILDGVKPYPAKLALTRLEFPHRASLALARSWGGLSSPLRQHLNSNWWSTFVELIPTQEIPYAKT